MSILIPHRFNFLLFHSQLCRSIFSLEHPQNSYSCFIITNEILSHFYCFRLVLFSNVYDSWYNSCLSNLKTFKLNVSGHNFFHNRLRFRLNFQQKSLLNLPLQKTDPVVLTKFSSVEIGLVNDWHRLDSHCYLQYITLQVRLWWFCGLETQIPGSGQRFF